MMKIAILRGNPCRNGSSNLLVDNFIRGAGENGHEIIDIDLAHADIHPCTGCKACGFDGKPCPLDDAMAEIKAQISMADMLVFCYAVVLFWNVCIA